MEWMKGGLKGYIYYGCGERERHVAGCCVMLSKSRAWEIQNERTSMLCLLSERGPVFMAAIEGCGPTRGRNEIIIIHTLLFLTLAPLQFSWFSCVLLRWMALAQCNKMRICCYRRTCFPFSSLSLVHPHISHHLVGCVSYYIRV